MNEDERNSWKEFGKRLGEQVKAHQNLIISTDKLDGYK